MIGIDDDPIATWSDDLLVPDGEIGEFVVSGPGRDASNTSIGPNRPRSPRSRVPAGTRFYHRMGDVGYRDDRGRLWFCGRKSHRVIAGGETYFTIPV